jgi:CRP-like cAMP-binding protein
MASRIAAAATPRVNLLLAALPASEKRRLMARGQPVELTFGDVLYDVGDQMEHVYFPSTSFISVISAVDKSSRLEVGLVGAEGVLGLGLLLGVTASPLRALVQGAGAALRIDATEFTRALKRSPVLTQLLNRYLYVVMSQLAQMAGCTRFHVVEARLARWLLMTRDRAHSNNFRLTQEFLAYMLGVRRAGITRAASELQKRGLIHYTRGRMTIVDVRGLEKASCECYADAMHTYTRLLN